jgi:hypothetical protein
MRWRSFFRGMTSISFMAEGLIKTLYPPTALKILDDVLKREVRFSRTLVEGRQVLRVLGQTELDGFVDKIRERPTRFRCLQPQCSMEIRIEVDSGSFL